MQSDGKVETVMHVIVETFV